MGYLYTEISGEHALYSNDESVIKKLELAGYHMTGYFSRKLIVDMREEAKINNLSINEDDAIIVENDKMLRYGPYYDLREGYYTVTYDISLPRIDMYQEDYKVCTLLICVRWGTEVAEIPVFRKDFDEKGEIHSEIRVKIGECRGCEFKVYPENGRSVLLKGISCQKTPDYDTHCIYDRKGRAIRTDYYDLMGNPIEVAEGYHAVECEYNNKNLPVFYRYFDKEGNPVNSTLGYAAIEIAYDKRKRIIKEIYYDKDGSRLTISEGYSAVTYGYDYMGNRNEYRYYDTKDMPVMLSDGYSVLKRSFNDKGQVICREYFDINNNPIVITGGFSLVTYDYDDSNRELYRGYYGTDGKPVVSDYGFSQRSKILDNEGRVIREEYFGSDGKRMVNSDGYSIVVYKYDIYGNLMNIYYYDEYEEPVFCDDY